MTGELGQLALCFALALSLVMAGAGLYGARTDASLARAMASSAALGMLVFVMLAFGALTYGFIVSDFSILDVASNSSTLKPLIYRISGVWGNHEGSMLLWVLVLSLYAGLVAFLQRGGPRLTSAALVCRACWPQRSCCSSSSHPIRSCASTRRHSRAQVSIRCCRIRAWRCIRPCSMQGMSGCRRHSPMPPPR